MNDEQAAAAQEQIARALAEASTVDFDRLEPLGQDYWRDLAIAAVAAMAAVSRDLEDERRRRDRSYSSRIDFNYEQQFRLRHPAPFPPNRIDDTYAQGFCDWGTRTVTNSANSSRLRVGGAVVDFADFLRPAAQSDNPDPDEE